MPLFAEHGGGLIRRKCAVLRPWRKRHPGTRHRYAHGRGTAEWCYKRDLRERAGVCAHSGLWRHLRPGRCLLAQGAAGAGVDLNVHVSPHRISTVTRDESLCECDEMRTSTTRTSLTKLFTDFSTM